MKENEEDEKLIGDLIKKRKEETEAFIKLLHAIEGKAPVALENENEEPKPKEIINPKSIL